MKLHIRKKLLTHTDNAKILNNKAIRPNLIKIGKEAVKTFGFPFFTDRVYSNINLFSLSVNRLNRCLKLVPGEICGS